MRSSTGWRSPWTRPGRGSGPCCAWSTSTASKAVNDQDGHLAGDAVLKDVAAALTAAVRDTDTVARLGGDEFAVLARTTPELTGEALAERLRAAVAARAAARSVTASVGLARIESGDDVESALRRADEAMYRAKVAGGDRADTRDGGPGLVPLTGSLS